MAKNKPIYREYTGEEILHIPEETYVPIVDNILYKNDLSVVVGRYKSLKSITAMQLACCISSGTPFLKTFKVPKAQTVWYFSTEGKDNEIKDRFLRMGHCIPTNLDNIVLFCSTQLKFNSQIGNIATTAMLEKHKDKLPGVIIIDSLYSGYNGTLISDEQMNSFITVIRGFMEDCDDCACLILHHFTKELKDSQQNAIRQTSQNAYGSVFLLGQADSVFTISSCDKNEKQKVIQCPPEDQRSGNIVELMRVDFHEPDPLYLSLMSIHAEEERKILRLLDGYSDGLTTNELLSKSKIKKSLIYIVLGELQEKGKIVKADGYGGKWNMAKQEEKAF